jgi:type VI secretion system secreted protein Hcp
MAFAAFLKISTIEGESTDAMHKGWIDLLSYSHGVEEPRSLLTSARGISAEQADSHDFTITKAVDKASHELMAACTSGQHFSEVNVEICFAGGDKQKYMEYKLTGVGITSIRPADQSSNPEAVPAEVVTFSYAEVEMACAQPDKATGKAVGQIPEGQDLKANKKA